jgi:hypothetical protein
MSWINDRAQHLQVRNPSLTKEAAVAIAATQARLLGKEAAPAGLMGFKPGAWRAQAGFTPKGMMTPAQRLEKNTQVGFFNPDKGLKPLGAKLAFTQSEYSGDMNPPRIRHESGAPPFTAPPIKVAGPPSQKKTAAPLTPVARLSAAKAVGAPKVTAPAGPSIAQIAKPKGFGIPMPGATKTSAEKTALLERLVRLGATPIPNTPKLLMKLRSPAELGALQNAVESGWNKRVTQPLLGKLQPLAAKAPAPLRGAAEFAAKEVAKDPVGGAYTVLGPGGMVYPAIKRGLERAIDRVLPLNT